MDRRISTIDAYIVDVSDDWMTLPTVHQRVLDNIQSLHEKAVPMPSFGVIHHRLHVLAEQGRLEVKQRWGKHGGCYDMWRRNRRHHR